ncbi:hypothetical protein CMI48_01135 [Candidatus Pacearchaeota archaeon]|jgi:hypothetical protein|nr:hypothetical protein [Candidatus Pacearchaeota archaeon]|tara:strand:+ start:117 stop:377 length:261 start_codon:yes stop_codon:yes gene_type:complete
MELVGRLYGSLTDMMDHMESLVDFLREEGYVVTEGDRGLIYDIKKGSVHVGVMDVDGVRSHIGTPDGREFDGLLSRHVLPGCYDDQ